MTDHADLPDTVLLRHRLGRALAERRADLERTQAQVAADAGLSVKYLGDVERGDANATIDIYERLAATLDWDPIRDARASFTEGVQRLLIEQNTTQIAQHHAMIASLEEQNRWLSAMCVSGGKAP
jgi:transcriptional regulator with XRE-family HTH domain